ncbi:hypothetical protein HQ520_02625 [bacterium]|nr:hypothetical protein [bacterium]
MSVDLSKLIPPPNCPDEIWRDDDETPHMWVITLPDRAYMVNDLSTLPLSVRKFAYSFGWALWRREYNRALADEYRTPQAEQARARRRRLDTGHDQSVLWRTAFEEVSR